MMMHRNTPHQDVGLSPEEMLYGRAIKDHLPIFHKKHQIPKHWTEMKELRESVMAKRHLLNQKQYNMHSHPLQELQVGELVQVQNQEEPYPQQQMKTGRVVETIGNRQYHIWLDSSSRLTLHNCYFFDKILPGVDTPDYLPKQPLPQRPIPINSEPPSDTPELIGLDVMDDTEMMVDHHTTDKEVEKKQHLIIHLPVSSILRRSTRVVT